MTTLLIFAALLIYMAPLQASPTPEPKPAPGAQAQLPFGIPVPAANRWPGVMTSSRSRSVFGE